jgi:hypothetical protein
LAILALLTPIMAFQAPSLVSPGPVDPVPVIELRYTRAGVLQLNRTTGATRFVPYRLAGPLDRRGQHDHALPKTGTPTFT